MLTGLYRYMRHPNYLGEIMLQVGLLVAGLSVIGNWVEALAVTIAPGYILVLMLSEAKRADEALETRYRDHPRYQAWRAATGSLLPRFGGATRESSSPGGT